MKIRTNAKKLRTCRKCRGDLPEKTLQAYCPGCLKIVEEVFDKIKAYLKEFPGSTSFEIEQRLGIPVHVINNFVRDGRLIEIDNQFINIQCLRCDCLLLSAHHKYCPKCENEMLGDLQKAKDSFNDSASLKVKDDARMRFRTYWEER